MAAANSPRKFACPSCGAAIPAGTEAGATGTCAYCGGTYSVPDDSPQSGIHFQAGGGVVIHGDVVGRDKVELGAPRSPSAPETIRAEPPKPQLGVAGGAEDRRPAVAPAAESFLARLKRWLRRR